MSLMTDDELKALLEANAAETRRGFASVDGQLSAIDARVTAIDARVTAIDARVTAIDAQVTAIDGRFTAIDGRFTAIDGRFTAIDARFTAIDARFTAVETRIDESAAETRRQIGVAREATKHDVDLVAESVLQTREELRRTRLALDEKIEHTAAETQSMIKFSHQELDRRMTALEGSQRALEETVADLQARVQRLEGSTH
jgi:chromosome segregation ATPase